MLTHHCQDPNGEQIILPSGASSSIHTKYLAKRVIGGGMQNGSGNPADMMDDSFISEKQK
jgi:hypothetical protein